MNRLIACLFAIGVTCTSYALCLADGSAGVDAGVTCESRSAKPTVACGDSASMFYDGCRWSCAPIFYQSPVASSLAPSAAVTPLPDPTTAPLDAASDLRKLYRSGAWVPLAILTAFFLLVVLSKKWAWLSDGNRKVYVASAIGGLAVLAAPASQGTTPNLAMLVAAIGSALALWTNPKPPA